jgi:high-affinity Fe2+/Pb2+ permease
MAEKQAEHRQRLESVVVHGNTWMGKAGVVFGGVIAILGLCVIALAIYREAPLEYLGGILASLAVLAGLFLWARRKKVRDAEKLQEGMRSIFREDVAPHLAGKGVGKSAPSQP